MSTFFYQTSDSRVQSLRKLCPHDDSEKGAHPAFPKIAPGLREDTSPWTLSPGHLKHSLEGRRTKKKRKNFVCSRGRGKQK